MKVERGGRKCVVCLFVCVCERERVSATMLDLPYPSHLLLLLGPPSILKSVNGNIHHHRTVEHLRFAVEAKFLSEEFEDEEPLLERELGRSKEGHGCIDALETWRFTDGQDGLANRLLHFLRCAAGGKPLEKGGYCYEEGVTDV